MITNWLQNLGFKLKNNELMLIFSCNLKIFTFKGSFVKMKKNHCQNNNKFGLGIL